MNIRLIFLCVYIFGAGLIVGLFIKPSLYEVVVAEQQAEQNEAALLATIKALESRPKCRNEIPLADVLNVLGHRLSSRAIEVRDMTDEEYEAAGS